MSNPYACLNFLFQFTHPWRCDEYCRRWIRLRGMFQSTHPWRCDNKADVVSLEAHSFNPHPWRCDAGALPVVPSGKMFQSTHPWRCDHLSGSITVSSMCFNPHTREGVTKTWNTCMGAIVTVSIHTPVKVWQSAFDALFKPEFDTYDG